MALFVAPVLLPRDLSPHLQVSGCDEVEDDDGVQLRLKSVVHL